MSQTEKAEYYRELQAAGVKFDRHYRDYSTDELKAAADKLRAEQPVESYEPPQQEGLFPPPPAATPPQAQRAPQAPQAQRNPNEMPGQRLNSKAEDEPIRTDEQGRIWYQEEVLKPAFPKPRGRRVLKYLESGTKTETVKNGDYIETFEVSGDRAKIPAEVKVTLPSYQVGIYKDPRFPFRIHTYNGRQGFALFEVQNFYGGAELVPAEIKRIYVENVLCYDIRTTVRAIQTEYRQLQLAGKVK